MKKSAATCEEGHVDGADGTHRARILNAAFQVLMERGYAGAGTLEIATRAKVSKRELYAQFGNKQGILTALIAERAARMRQPLALPDIRDRASLAATLVGFGTAVLREVCHPAVAAIYRLAVAESERSPEVGRALDAAGRDPNRAALTELLARAQSCGVLESGDTAAMAGQFFALLWGDLLVRVLLGVTKAPTAPEMERRARAATETLLRLHAAPQRP